MKRTRLVSGLLLLALVSAIGSAQAQSSTSGAGTRSWAGVHIGVFGGYAWHETAIRDGGTAITNPPFGAFACGPALTGNYCNQPMTLGPEGLLGGVLAGITWQDGPLVFGIEGDFGRLDLRQAKTLFRPFDDRDFASIDASWNANLTVRLGYAWDQWLLYAKGGAAFSRLEISAADIDQVFCCGGGFAIYPGSLTRFSRVSLGWTAGGGIERALSDRLTLRAEYMFTMLGSETSRSPDGDIYRHENEFHSFRIGLNYVVFRP